MHRLDLIEDVVHAAGRLAGKAAAAADVPVDFQDVRAAGLAVESVGILGNDGRKEARSDRRARK